MSNEVNHKEELEKLFDQAFKRVAFANPAIAAMVEGKKGKWVGIALEEVVAGEVIKAFSINTVGQVVIINEE